MLTPDMRAVIEAAHLCFAATVTPEGRPNLSPKGTIRVWDDARLFFLDIASPGTRANLERAPWMELNVVEQLSRRGYRFSGPAGVHHEGSAVYAEGVRRVYGETSPAQAPAAVVLLAVERAAPLLSPAYWRVADETALREIWRARREALDREFEGYLARAEPVRVVAPDEALIDGARVRL
ncbi:MAG TPA: pyridoxamine 5'-phosphate oxidase family protein [Gemmatimonadaceae bacterium]|nr:pyridoxamine 5'-phosphate oxidase family protein [Gemmatimonadaceae bacterium]